MGNFEKVLSIFEGFFEECNSDSTAALLTLSTILEGISERFSERLSHDICLGLRHGFFGVNAHADDSIKDIVGSLVSGLQDLEQENDDRE